MCRGGTTTQMGREPGRGGESKRRARRSGPAPEAATPEREPEPERERGAPPPEPEPAAPSDEGGQADAALTFPEASAVPFVRVLDDGAMEVTDEAAALLEGLRRPLAVVAIAGKYRTGKSTLVGRLAGRPGCFGIGHSVQPCTRGCCCTAACWRCRTATCC